MADEVAHGGDDHAVDGGDTPVNEVGGDSAQDNTDDGKPVDLLGGFRGLVGLPVQEVAQHQNDAYRGQGAVEDIQPAAEVPVQPDGSNGAC